jgi:hypothetical protein
MGLQIKNKLSHLSRVPYGVFLVLFVLSLGVSMYALRQNNQEMVRLRSAVYEADKDGGNVEKALSNLRSYVHGHMNTDLSSGGNAIKPPIQLKYTYERLVAAEQAKVDALNSQVYTEAQEFCQVQNPSSFSGGPRVPCVEEFVTAHGPAANESEISAALYKFDFVTPLWTLDLAGLSLVLSVLLFMAFTAGFLVDRTVKARIKSQEI